MMLETDCAPLLAKCMPGGAARVHKQGSLLASVCPHSRIGTEYTERLPAHWAPCPPRHLTTLLRACVRVLRPVRVRYAPQGFVNPTTTTHSYASQGCYTVSARALEAPNSGPSSSPSKNMAQSSTWARIVKVSRRKWGLGFRNTRRAGGRPKAPGWIQKSAWLDPCCPAR